jgi:ABC-type sugar transport system ATPase subunit
MGDNGAGKSTLVNILSGELQPSGGTILLDGQPISFQSSLQARSCGIETVYQDLALASELSVWANLFLGRELTKKHLLGRLGWLDRAAMAEATRVDLDKTQIRIGSVNSLVGQLSGGQRQAIAVTRAVSWGSRIVLLDEPTAALGVEQQEKVAELIASVSASGTPILLISHNLPQVHRLSHRILVLFQGRIVADLDPAKCNADEIISWITGAATVASGDAGQRREGSRG